MIDADKKHDPGRAVELIDAAKYLCEPQTQAELARRLGMSRETLRLYQVGKQTMPYSVQVLLERLILEELAGR